jgi:hypothetical protein
MTIAAVFPFPDGVLFCADTQHTSGIKQESTKLFFKASGAYPCGATSVFAICGDVMPAKMVMQRCERAFTDFKGALSAHGALGLVEDVVARTYREHLRYTKNETALLGGIYCPADRRIVLVGTDNASVNELVGCSIIGSGGDLGNYLMWDYYQGLRYDTGRLEPMFCHAMRSLEDVKSYDTNCGKASEAIWINHDGLVSERVRLNNGSEVDAALIKLRAATVPQPIPRSPRPPKDGR